MSPSGRFRFVGRAGSCARLGMGLDPDPRLDREPAKDAGRGRVPDRKATKVTPRHPPMWGFTGGRQGSRRAPGAAPVGDASQGSDG
jgi:hypothetical protein